MAANTRRRAAAASAQNQNAATAMASGAATAIAGGPTQNGAATAIAGGQNATAMAGGTATALAVGGNVLPSGQANVLPSGQANVLPSGQANVLPSGQANVLPSGQAGGAAAAASLPPPKTPEQLALDDLDMCLFECGVAHNAGRARLIKSQGLTGLRDLASLSSKDVKSLIETFNDTCKGNTAQQTIGFMPVMKICALAYAVNKSQRMGETFDVDAWDDNAIDSTRREMEYVKSDDKAHEPHSVKNADDKTIDTEYEEWRSSGMTSFGQMSSVLGNGLMLDYVGRVDVPNQVFFNDYDKMKYAAALYGPAYERDKRRVWSMVKRATEHTKAYAYIQKYDRTQDGRAALMELDRIFLGPDFIQKRITRSFLIVDLGHRTSVLYHGETSGLPWLNYSGMLVKQYNYIEVHRGKVDENSQVLRLVNGITGEAKSRLSYAINITKDNHAADMSGAITYMSGKVNDAYGEIIVKQGSHGGGRKISEASGRGPGGGRGRGGGRFGGRFHGGRGRGGHNDARYDGRTEVKQIDGVNCSDAVINGYFKWLGGPLKAYVLKRREFLKENGGNANSKRQIQELTSRLKDMEEQMKRARQGDNEDADNGETKSEKGGKAGATFGKNARQK
eukprot:scaffold11571_cov153-Skeletonema_dohrnii-CCMP3373.AAC.2